MALAAANMRLINRAVNLFAVGSNLDASLEKACNRPGYCCVELHELAGVSLQDARYGTCLA